MEKSLVIVAIFICAFWVCREWVWKKRFKNLKLKLKTLPEDYQRLQNQNKEIEIELIIALTRVDGVEKLLANGWTLIYSHTFGVCAKRKTDACWIELDEAILIGVYSEINN